MSVYMTEEEQLEIIKKWWKRYGNMITIFLSIVLLIIAGYRYMNWHNDKIKQQASIAYENMMIAFSNQHIKSVRSYANELIKNYNHTVYADIAHMTLAKIYVSKNKLEQARNELKAVASESQMTPLRQIAKIRIARLLAADKAYTNALNELSAVEDEAYLPVINELKGDIYSAKGQYQDAMNAYRLAIDEVRTNGMGNLFLEMKTNELAIKTQSMITDDKKVKAA
ncbi:TPA: YfgM family protein [Legionella pneumophila]|nr:tetratricopeptide repeat protein [Legionella pneumophila]HAT1883671.1 tetratricopeptide repeat protein [Legionella pneumophila]HAT2114508.1 tetratricopeptide repeat protein [Legionella pneumophila]HAT2116159.1 tetratricopeptide repeat protein [Legionella pneumophila]HAT8720001.1 tetratricopeptide repeat protein [Legionella pneumophila]HAT8721751.1 tetratricopeptide repeat protein [Legionella pneumophila]